MVGFIKNLFGSKNNNGEQLPRQKQKAFFLDPDEAKTYGDIEYMRKPNTVRRSFPKSLGNPEGGEQIEEVSALEKKSLSKPKKSNQQTNNQAAASSQSMAQEGQVYSAQDDPQIEERRKSDSSLDMFRNMARDIKK